tara:strand:+ start:176 stop:415 length:240 start_codon:yes stop_codon:yes gene_type:complete
MVVALTSNRDFKSKIKSILDDASLRGELGVLILTDRKWHLDIFNFMKKNKHIDEMNMGGKTFFVIEEIAIELKPIDYYI